MSWGNRLLLVFVLFAALMAYLVYKAVNTKFELVSKDYYKDELRYQDKIDGFKNAAKLSQTSILQTKDSLSIVLPAEMKGAKLKGEAWFYCTTDASKDRRIELIPNQNAIQQIAKTALAVGDFTLKLTWEAGGTQYYSEQLVAIH